MSQIRVLTGGLAAIFLSNASMAEASGSVAMPERQQKMASFAACLAFLEDSAAQDRKSEAPLTRDTDGNRRAVTLERRTDGVERSSKTVARYGARVWYSNGKPLPEFGKIEYRASWEEHDYECRGRMLIINTSQGYTLESYMPIDVDKAASDQPAPIGTTGVD